MRIYKSLRYLFPDPSRGYRCLRTANEVYCGQSALQRMLAASMQDLAAVRAYLDVERGGW